MEKNIFNKITPLSAFEYVITGTMQKKIFLNGLTDFGKTLKVFSIPSSYNDMKVELDHYSLNNLFKDSKADKLSLKIDFIEFLNDTSLFFRHGNSIKSNYTYANDLK